MVQNAGAEIGSPQGGPISPLLSYILLDELDRELKRRGHRFVRYADDFLVLVKSERTGQRVKASLTACLDGKLRLPVNESKSQVAKSNCRSKPARIHIYFPIPSAGQNR
jgi:RNA-directed DNA polymerase